MTVALGGVVGVPLAAEDEDSTTATNSGGGGVEIVVAVIVWTSIGSLLAVDAALVGDSVDAAAVAVVVPVVTPVFPLDVDDAARGDPAVEELASGPVGVAVGARVGMPR